MQHKANEIITEVLKAVVGKDDVVIKVFMAILAKGHILLDDIPGVGKTTIAMAFSRAMSLDCKRLQFTPDVMPSDITGFSIYDKQTGALQYRPGAALCNLFLADEINRTSSKTQSALLEVMEEGRVTVDGVTRPVPQPYTVIATQNPVGSAGTHLLPESQMDRFIMKLSVGYPKPADEVEILKRKRGSDPIETIVPVASQEDVIAMQQATERVYICDAVYRYIASLVGATRQNPLLKLGASPRGSLALSRLAKAAAYLSGRDYVVPEDVAIMFPDAVCHRLLLSPQAKSAGMSVADVVGRIAREVPAPAVSCER